MNILLDTHYLLWAFFDTTQIKPRLYQAMLSEENEVFYSQASLWEIAIKYSMGKLVMKDSTPEGLYEELENSYMKCRELRNEELISFHHLPIEHKDPFDRIMIWQALKSDYYFLTADNTVKSYTKHGLKILS